jgi:hypothetical protein
VKEYERILCGTYFRVAQFVSSMHLEVYRFFGPFAEARHVSIRREAQRPVLFQRVSIAEH